MRSLGGGAFDGMLALLGSLLLLTPQLAKAILHRCCIIARPNGPLAVNVLLRDGARMTERDNPIHVPQEQVGARVGARLCCIMDTTASHRVVRDGQRKRQATQNTQRQTGYRSADTKHTHTNLDCVCCCHEYALAFLLPKLQLPLLLHPRCLHQHQRRLKLKSLP